VRKAIDRAHIEKSPPEAKTIKLADLISNTKTIVPLDPDFARVYMREKMKLMEILKEGDETLYQIAIGLCQRYYEGTFGHRKVKE
jgi:hypothetical protein